MNPRKIAALPVDGRPVVRQQVIDLVAAGGWQLAVPPVAELGLMRRPADRDALADWLEAEARDAAGVIVSIDMLVYGGLVPSRFIADIVEDLAQRLHLLRRLKAQAPARPLYAFAATMRLSNNNVADEEKPYWAEFGALIWAWSFHADRFAQAADPADQQAAAAAQAAIPAAVQADYRATRARNFSINQQLLALVREGAIDRLILPQDDTAAYGFNIAERRALQAAVTADGLGARVLIYPGADEVLHTLSAHLVARLRGDPPLRLALSCSDPAHVGALHARYEDRPLLDALASQVAAVGAELVMAPASMAPASMASASMSPAACTTEPVMPAQAGIQRRTTTAANLDSSLRWNDGRVVTSAPPDLLLALHSQGRSQGDWAMRLPLPEPVPPDIDWLAGLRAHLDAGGALAVADLAYANGGDPILVDALAALGLLPRLSAYAGWNTASNSLGSLLAQLVLARDALDSPANRLNTALRLAEDFLYQARLRQTLRDGIDEPALSPAELAAQAAALVVPATDAWLSAHGLPGRVSRCHLPWDRTFEIGLELRG